MKNIFKIKKLVLLCLTITIAILAAGRNEPRQYAWSLEDPLPVLNEIDLLLFESVKNNDIEGVRKQICGGANVNSFDPDEEDEAPLHIAITSNNLEIVQELIIAGADVNKKDLCGNSPLHYAAKYDCPEIGLILINAGADINIPNVSEKIPMLYAKKNSEIYNVLTAAKKKNFNLEFTNGDTLLHHAVMENNLGMVKQLIAAGADVNRMNSFSKKSPLHIATEAGFLDIVKVLIQAKANVNQISFYKKTSLHFAAENDHADVVKELIHAKAKINPKDMSGQTPLDLAILKGYVKTAKELIKLGADVHKADQKSMTPPDLAINKNNEDMIELLRTAGADRTNQTPIARAIMLRNVKVVKEAIRKDKTIINKPCDYRNRTPIELAIFWEQPEIENILRQANQDVDINNSSRYRPSSSTNNVNATPWLNVISTQGSNDQEQQRNLSSKKSVKQSISGFFKKHVKSGEKTSDRFANFSNI